MPEAGTHTRKAVTSGGMVSEHFFTIDVEEYFQVSALEPFVAREAWPLQPSRVEASTYRLLELLDAAGSRSTCFILGWIAERFPALVRDIAAAGHEVASHGQDHRRVTGLSPEEFRASVRRSRAVLEDVSGRQVLGFRAPSFSIVPGLEWALEILVEEGYAYDSSLFPIRRAGYGYPGTPRGVHTMHTPAGPLVQVPPATIRVGGATLPAAGGGYFRLLPYPLVRAGLRDAAKRGERGTFYIHPWEIDAGQPRYRVPVATRVRHYAGLAGTEPRLRRLMKEFRFTSIAAAMPEFGGVKCSALPIG